MPSERIATGKCRDEAVDALHLGQAEQVAHRVGIDLLDAAGDDLVEHRLGVAHAAGGALRDQVDRVVGDGSAFRLRDAAQLAANLLLGEWPEREALQARDDGWSDARRIGRAEDEQDVGRRLLERLEEDVPAFLDALDLVDDEDLALEVGRRVV